MSKFETVFQKSFVKGFVFLLAVAGLTISVLYSQAESKKNKSEKKIQHSSKSMVPSKKAKEKPEEKQAKQKEDTVIFEEDKKDQSKQEAKKEKKEVIDYPI
ncbi:MAG TPA: hypothetical protein PKC66_07760, partial [Leptospiraceae bacterium]|nr:hypothetical protein [Leptospiraceae bacterium]